MLPEELLDLKWFAMTANASLLGAPSGLKAWASGWRALLKAAEPTRIATARRG